MEKGREKVCSIEISTNDPGVTTLGSLHKQLLAFSHIHTTVLGEGHMFPRLVRAFIWLFPCSWLLLHVPCLKQPVKCALTRGVDNLDFHVRPAREIKFYPMHIFSRKTSFSIYDLGFQVGPSSPRYARPTRA
jgi:hypothetical protein